MNQLQFQALCIECDRLLLAPDAGRSRRAIAWLHIIREHPLFLARYEALFAPVSWRFRAKSWLALAGYLAAWLRQFWRARAVQDAGIAGLTGEPSPIDVLIVSHLVNTAHLQRDDDFYFDRLGQELNQVGMAVVTALIDHTAGSQSGTVSSEPMPAGRVVLKRVLALRDEWGIFVEQLHESFRLMRGAFVLPAGFSRSVMFRAAKEALSGETRASRRIATQIALLVKRHAPAFLITTYEGHAWERLAYEQARQMRPELRCIGYQHAALFRLQHALKRSLGKPLDPDLVVTSGPAAVSQLTGCGIGDIRVLGSNRAASLADFPDEHERKLRQLRPVCLVLPEGLESEVFRLFAYSLSCAKEMPEVVFLWRMHPAMTFEALCSRYPVFRQLPANIEVSTQSLPEDAGRSSWVLYRGSTAVVAAVLAGAAPIYLRAADEMTIDPLYALDDARATVASVEDFIQLLPAGGGGYPTPSQADVVARHCLELFSPLDPGVVAHYIHSISDVS